MNIKVKRTKTIEVEEDVDIGEVPLIDIAEISLTFDDFSRRTVDIRGRLLKTSYAYSVEPGRYALVRIV